MVTRPRLLPLLEGFVVLKLRQVGAIGQGVPGTQEVAAGLDIDEGLEQPHEQFPRKPRQGAVDGCTGLAPQG